MPASESSAASTEEVEELLNVIYNALGWIEPGRGDRDYDDAKKALARLRVILDA